MRRRGCVDQLTNGRFRLRMGVAGKQRTIGFYDTREDAERNAMATADVVKESAAEYDGLTLAELGRKVLTRRDVRKQVRDPRSDWSRWDTHVKTDLIAKLAVKRIRPEHITKWLRRLEDKRLAPQTRRNCLNLVRTVLSEALADGDIKMNPAQGLRVKGTSPDAWTYLQPAEQVRLLEVLPEVERHIVAVAMGTGLRAGELVTLRLADLHVDGPNPFALIRFGKAPDKPTKTRTVRSVPIFGMALAALRSWLQVLSTYAPENPNGLVFPRPRGGFRSETHVIPWTMWKGGTGEGELLGARIIGALEAAGISRRFRWHDLRHTCASSLVSGWWGRRWSLVEVKEMLGHTSINVTQRYAHLAASALEEAATAASSGDYSKAASSGDSGIAASIGANGLAKAGANGLVIVTYWVESEKRYRACVGNVGENGIMADTWYRVQDGRLAECAS